MMTTNWQDSPVDAAAVVRLVSWRSIVARTLSIGLLVAGLMAPAAHAQMGGLGGMGGGAGVPGMPGGPKSKKLDYYTPVFERREQGEPIVAVKIVGNQVHSTDKIRAQMQTREGRDFDPEVVRADVRRLSSSGMFRNVNTYRKQVEGGVEITFEVFELPTITSLKFVGNTHVKEKSLRKKAELKEGEPLQRFRIEEGKRKLEEFYREKGYSDAKVEIQEGLDPADKGVVFSIYEGELKRIYSTKFVGNTIVSDARLKTQIESKPGILWYFKGQVDSEKIDEDVEKLTAYYRSLGYFRARVGRELEYGDSGKWLTVTFVIDEGPRYKIRNVSIVGNKTFTTDSLSDRLELHAGEFFDSRRMEADLSELKDTYGSQGYIQADIKADPRFLEEPGMIDLVYDIAEGEQYRVGRVIVNIEGENPHTKRNVVINRLSLAPNDIIDIREIRASERRLKASELFLTDPMRGIAPTIAIKPPELGEEAALARKPGASSSSPY
jgi:outer membrane protein insertion porin family